MSSYECYQKTKKKDEEEARARKKREEELRISRQKELEEKKEQARLLELSKRNLHVSGAIDEAQRMAGRLKKQNVIAIISEGGSQIYLVRKEKHLERTDNSETIWTSETQSYTIGGDIVRYHQHALGVAICGTPEGITLVSMEADKYEDNKFLESIRWNDRGGEPRFFKADDRKNIATSIGEIFSKVEESVLWY